MDVHLLNLDPNLPNQVQPGLEPIQNQNTFNLQKIKLIAVSALAASIYYYCVNSLYPWFQLDQLREDPCPRKIDDIAKSFNHLSEVAKKGNPLGQYCLAKMYRDGNGIKKSIPTAIEWFQRAAKQGLYLAVNELCHGWIYSNMTDIGRSKIAKDLNLVSICKCDSTIAHCPWDPKDAFPFLATPPERSFDFLRSFFDNLPTPSFTKEIKAF